MHWNILIGCGLVVLTTFIHAGAMVFVLHSFKIMRAEHWAHHSLGTRATAVSVVVLVMFVASVIEAAVWAVVYVAIGAISTFEKALYFSMVTYTTLGYGDVVMAEGRRLLSALEAACGIIMFGWTTAVIVATVHRLYLQSREKNDV